MVVVSDTSPVANLTLNRYAQGNENFVCVVGSFPPASYRSCRSESDGFHKSVECFCDREVKLVELGHSLRWDAGVSGIGLEKTGRQRSLDSLEEFQKNNGDTVALREQEIAAGAGDFLHESFSPQLG